ncbi:hypothetical protein [Hathewaya massiliensis]|uniref:hypothetical protein n=1 Tax=Hathewaya massiliensis TaxID=1964382 RepID=UPI00163CC78A|nr:hypothetical protein [Hathewaya massiliensis]
MEERINKINFVVSLVQKLCEEAEIALIPKERKGKLIIVVRDARDGKEYYITTDK